MAEIIEYPNTLEEFINLYSFTNRSGTRRLMPTLRVYQAIEHYCLTKRQAVYEDFILLPKPRKALVSYGLPSYEEIKDGDRVIYKAVQPVEIKDDAIRDWAREIDDELKRVIVATFKEQLGEL